MWPPLAGTRRAFVAGLATACARAEGNGRHFPSEWRKFPDPATEFEVLRLTDPAHSSYLPSADSRPFTRRGNSLLFWSDRTGKPQAFRMDLKSGDSRQVTDAEALDGSTLTLAPDERSFCYFDGASFRQMNFSSLKDREIYRVPEGWQRCPGLCVAGDYSALFGESKDGRSRIRRVGMSKGVSSTVLEVPFVLCHPVARPRRSQILYRQGDEALWMVDFNGANNRKLRTPGGRIGQALWSPDGKTALYLHLPEDPARLNAIREFIPDDGLDKMVSPTSQFVDFGPNTDGSVFVGASRNKNSPHILILLRVTRRELTLCEHRSSDPSKVSPVFSPDSQKIYFQSDKHGKPAIYRVQVDKFVEKTEEEAS